MLEIDKSKWPLVVFEFRGEQSLEEHQRMLDEWNLLFSRQQNFVAVRLFHDDIAVNHSKEIGQLTLSWLDNGAAEAIKTWVSAMLNVTPEATYLRMKNKSVERVFGVPGGIFKSTDDANQWLDVHLDEKLNISTPQ